MNKTCVLIIFLSLIFSINGSAKKIINVADFGVTEQITDCTPGLVKCLQALKEEKNVELVFNKGTYNFYSEFGIDKYCFISNNDEGLKRIIFLIEEMHNFTLDGQGSEFIFHGFVNPFVINNSTNVTFKNFSIDFARSFHSEATIVANNSTGIDIEIPENFPFQLNNGTLIFTAGEKEQQRQTTVSKKIIYSFGSLLEFDSAKRETAYMVYDYYLGGTPLVAEKIGERKVRLFLNNLKGTIGNILVFAPDNRNYPGFAVSDCKDVLFHNITIYHSGGMGIVCQRSHNISVLSSKVITPEGRIISTTADATHFTNCTGKIELGNCVFKNQLDDATNIHGIYVQIVKKVSPTELIVQLKHSQQLGFDFLKKGIKVEFVQSKSLITKGFADVLTSVRLNKELTRITLSDSLPEGIDIGDALGEVGSSQFVHIHHNYIGKNRARGMLLNCRGKTIVENNTFHSPGAAILFEGDASYWFEQGGVTDCIIQNNLFDNCLFGVWGKAVIDVGAGITENLDVSRYNKNIKIINNTFRIFDDALLLHAYCVENLMWKDNKIERNNSYPPARTNNSLFKVEHSDAVQIKQ